MGTRQISVLRELDPDRIARLRREGEFFWADLDLAGDVTVERIAAELGLHPQDTEALGNFTRATSPTQKIHVGEELIVFRFWCVGRPDAPVFGGIGALKPFQVNVLLHGDFLLTVHRLPYDLPGEAAAERISHGRSERYAVYVALDGMTNTILEALAGIEKEIGDLETELLGTGLRSRGDEKEKIASLRDRLTGLRMRVGPERALFERVGEEIEQIGTLEGDRDAYFDRIQDQLNRAVDRIDAASNALSHALEIQLNEATKQLTIIATIFLPLTFIVGFFGMNFLWMTDQIQSRAHFLALGIGTWLVPLVAIALYLRIRDAARRSRSAARPHA